jgi:hypothetical protein
MGLLSYVFPQLEDQTLVELRLNVCCTTSSCQMYNKQPLSLWHTSMHLLVCFGQRPSAGVYPMSHVSSRFVCSARRLGQGTIYTN